MVQQVAGNGELVCCSPAPQCVRAQWVLDDDDAKEWSKWWFLGVVLDVDGVVEVEAECTLMQKQPWGQLPDYDAKYIAQL